MASGINSGAGAPAAISTDNWAQFTSYVEKLRQEAEQLRHDLGATATLPAPENSNLNKPTTIYGRTGSIDALASHMDT